MILYKLDIEIKKAMKEKQGFRLGALKMVKNEILVNQKSVKPTTESEAVQSYYKKVQKGLEIPGIEEKQPNYVKSLKEELGIVEEFLPKILTKEELIPFVMKHVPLGQTGAIIKAVKEEVTKNGYLFDGKLTSQLIVEFQATKE